MGDMTVATATPTATASGDRTPAEIKRAKIIAVVFFVLAAVALLVFALGGQSTTNLVMSLPSDAIQVPNIPVPVSAFGYVTAGVLAFLGTRQWMRGYGSRIELVIVLVMALFSVAFIVWAVDGQTFSLVGILQESVKRAVPITFGAISGVLCERVAVINIGIEGMLLAGAFTGAVVGSLAGATAGLLGAAVVGGLLALLLAVLAVKYRVDQIIAGVVINTLVLGLTSFYTSQILVQNQHLNNVRILGPIEIPLLSDIPVAGPILFAQNIFVYAMYVLVALSTFILFRTRWGLRSRAVGEHPKAADTLGVNVFKMRYMNVTIAGLVAGFGGAYFTIGSVGRFDEGMSGGRGYIGLAAMIFGRWHPVGALAAALIFGAADSLQVKLGILDTPIPSQFLSMAPYLLTIVVVAGVVGRSRPPAADGQPYIKD